MNCSIVRDEAGMRRSNDLLVPRCIQYTMVKLCSSWALKVRNNRISGKPGPPCNRIKIGLAMFSPRIITH